MWYVKRGKSLRNIIITVAINHQKHFLSTKPNPVSIHYDLFNGSLSHKLFFQNAIFFLSPVLFSQHNLFCPNSSPILNFWTFFVWWSQLFISFCIIIKILCSAGCKTILSARTVQIVYWNWNRQSIKKTIAHCEKNQNINQYRERVQKKVEKIGFRK